jgi:hypothetical protein
VAIAGVLVLISIGSLIFGLIGQEGWLLISGACAAYATVALAYAHSAAPRRRR